MTKSRSEQTTKPFASLAVILAVSLASSALLAAVIWAYNPDYLRDPSASRISDFGIYARLGHNFLQQGQ